MSSNIKQSNLLPQMSLFSNTLNSLNDEKKNKNDQEKNKLRNGLLPREPKKFSDEVLLFEGNLDKSDIFDNDEHIIDQDATFHNTVKTKATRDTANDFLIDSDDEQVIFTVNNIPNCKEMTKESKERLTSFIQKEKEILNKKKVKNEKKNILKIFTSIKPIDQIENNLLNLEKNLSKFIQVPLAKKIYSESKGEKFQIKKQFNNFFNLPSKKKEVEKEKIDFSLNELIEKIDNNGNENDIVDDIKILEDFDSKDNNKRIEQNFEDFNFDK